MTRRTHTYAIRLAVEGGGQVKAELVAVGQSGEQSLKRIETAGERASGGLKGLGRQAELLRTGIRTLGGALIGAATVGWLGAPPWSCSSILNSAGLMRPSSRPGAAARTSSVVRPTVRRCGRSRAAPRPCSPGCAARHRAPTGWWRAVFAELGHGHGVISIAGEHRCSPTSSSPGGRTRSGQRAGDRPSTRRARPP